MAKPRFSKDELKHAYEVTLRTQALRRGEAVMHDGVYVTAAEIAELATYNQRLAGDNEPSEPLYLDDKRCVRVCAIKAETEQPPAVAASTTRDRAQSPASTTTLQPRPAIAPSPDLV